MASAVDVTFPSDDVEVSKGDFRAQMLIISSEISALQKQVGLPGKIAFGTISLSTL